MWARKTETETREAEVEAAKRDASGERQRRVLTPEELSGMLSARARSRRS